MFAFSPWAVAALSIVNAQAYDIAPVDAPQSPADISSFSIGFDLTPSYG
jgi:hypothetical protein